MNSRARGGQPRVRPAGGFTLVEMLVAVSLGATVLGLVLGLLEGLFALDGGLRTSVRDRTTLARLAEQFRDDVHAMRVEDKLRPAGPRTWEIAIDGRMIEYRHDQNELLRTERTGEKIERREAFALPEGAALRVEQTGRMVVLQITKTNGEAARIEAAAGLDRRFEKSEKKP